jgi:hypothetical protein
MWQYPSANFAEPFAWCGWNRAEEFFNFKLKMFLFAYIMRIVPETKSSPDKQTEIIISSRCTSGNNHFFGSQNLSVCVSCIAKHSHLFSSAILMEAGGPVVVFATLTLTLC